MRIFITVLFLCMGSIFTKAQNANTSYLSEFQFGIKAGINYNELKGENFESAMQQDWHLGMYLQLRGEKMGLGIEAIYDRSRYELKDMVVDAANYHFLGDTSSNNAMLQAHKFQLPIYLMYKVSFVQLMAGAVYEMNIHFKDKEGFIEDTKQSFESNFPSGMIGIWIDVTKKINIGGRYLFGLENVNTSNWDNNWRSREAQVHLGIRF